MVKEAQKGVVERAPAPEHAKRGAFDADKASEAATSGVQKAKGNGDDAIEDAALSGQRPAAKNDNR